MKRLLSLFALVALVLFSAPLQAAERPNILWITAEDMSPTLGCYGDRYAVTPHIDRLAKRSVRYSHAFATAPVCSPARSCLINGVYATTQGTHNMRSAFPIPASMIGFPAFLKQAGYYTTNNVKTDYNSGNWETIIARSWDESSDQAHWRNRDKGQPFFSVFNLMTSHQSRTMVWPYEKFKSEVQSKLSQDEIHEPEKAPLPPYYPDTPVVRRAVARYYDCVTAMDKEVAVILRQLEEDGLADNTIVFFYSDHGSGMPRHKRALLDSGMHVPLLVHFPKKWRHLAPAAPGTTTDRLVSFVDFGPTVLSLAGVEIPEYMQGGPFLGPKKTEPRKYVYGHRDRVDEVYDMARSVRGPRYLYIRNYMPHLGYHQPSAWPDAGAVRGEFAKLQGGEKLAGPLWHYVSPTRPVEELYDCQADPQNLSNLADSELHRKELDRLRTALADHRTAINDLGYIPETLIWERIDGGKLPMNLPGKSLSKKEYLALIFAASQVGHSNDKQRIDYLKSEIAGVRYWGAVASSAAESLSRKMTAALERALADSSVTVRIEAAAALGRHGQVDKALPVLTAALEHENLSAVLHAARSIELLGRRAEAAVPAMKKVLRRAKLVRPADAPATFVQPGDVDMAMFIGFSAGAFLDAVAEKQGDQRDATDEGKSSATKPQASESADWIKLFDGKSLDGWNENKAKPGEVKVVDGEIHLLTKRNLWFLHTRSFNDFELSVEAHMPDDHYNSGVGFRCQTDKRFTGYQCEIDGAKSGMIYAIGRGWVWPKGKDQKAEFAKMSKGAFKPGQWNSFRIRCRGKHIQIWVNGQQTADVQDDLFSRGVVALQHHGRGGVHRFRNVKIRPLKAE